ncbi:PQ loop repeat domain-containing protein [Ditylenchus destructor]|uniref:PQ loop repeat domain-containing protein n=1 Tax=Ditylenchus destructor TaxID=166010 RepID=A0AAD4NAZ0_9BILA|nr:PQ loop repeat domain-containing protein [Ditylenchus destructor]KAI1720757.1 PQ loop repeat domain-containing protein [Ditylenchus destructor]
MLSYKKWRSNNYNFYIEKPTASHHFHEAFRYVFPENCYDELFARFDLLHETCVPLVLSRLFSIIIMIASSLVLIPQIVRIHNAGDSQGISLHAQMMGFIAAAGHAAYYYGKGYGFWQWVNTLLEGIQSAIIIAQTLWFYYIPHTTIDGYNTRASAIIFLLTCWHLSSYVGEHSIVLEILRRSYVGNVFASKGIQIFENYRYKRTGQLSGISIFLQFGVCLLRIYLISVHRSGNQSLILLTYAVFAVLNLITLGQILYYNRQL